MKTMTYRTLMKKVDEGYAEINAWTTTNDPALADVTFWKADGTRTREHVEVTNLPADVL